MLPSFVLAIIAQVAASPDPVTTYGPWAGAVALITALGRLVLQAYNREIARTDAALAGWAAQREANERLADVIESRDAQFTAALAVIQQKLERKA